MILLLDLDSTLVAEEGCKTISQWNGVEKQVSQLTKQNFEGVLDFNTAFPQKLLHISPSHADLDKLGVFLTRYVSDERKEFIRHLQSQGVIIGILSQGYTRSSLHVASMLDIDPERVFAVNFHHDNDGKFLWLDMSQDLMYYDGKKRIINTLRQQYPDEKIVFSWDSFNDLESGQAADLFVTYTGVVAREKAVAHSKYLAKTPEELYTHIKEYFSL